MTANIQPIIKYAQPVGTAAAQILGYLQPITAQEVKQLHVPVTGFSGDDLVGQAGLEAAVRQAAARHRRARRGRRSTPPAR